MGADLGVTHELFQYSQVKWRLVLCLQIKIFVQENGWQPPDHALDELMASC